MMLLVGWPRLAELCCRRRPVEAVRGSSLPGRAGIVTRASKRGPAVAWRLRRDTGAVSGGCSRRHRRRRCRSILVGAWRPSQGRLVLRGLIQQNARPLSLPYRLAFGLGLASRKPVAVRSYISVDADESPSEDGHIADRSHQLVQRGPPGGLDILPQGHVLGQQRRPERVQQVGRDVGPDGLLRPGGGEEAVLEIHGQKWWVRRWDRRAGLPEHHHQPVRSTRYHCLQLDRGQWGPPAYPANPAAGAVRMWRRRRRMAREPQAEAITSGASGRRAKIRSWSGPHVIHGETDFCLDIKARCFGVLINVHAAAEVGTAGLGIACAVAHAFFVAIRLLIIVGVGELLVVVAEAILLSGIAEPEA